MNSEIQIIIDFVEGKLGANDFRKEFNNNNKLQELLKKKITQIYLQNYQYCLTNYLKYDGNFNSKNWNTVFIRRRLQVNLEEFLKTYKIEFIKFHKYQEDESYFLDIQPDWLDIIDDQGIFDKLLEEVPKDLSKTKQIAWGKAKLKELFKFDKTYPRWIQGAEWPIIDGKPLVFSHQSKEKKEDERTYYYFYNPETKEQTVVMQMY